MVLNASSNLLGETFAEKLWRPTYDDSACGGHYDLRELGVTLSIPDGDLNTLKAFADRVTLSLNGDSVLEGDVQILYQGNQLITPSINLNSRETILQTTDGLTVISSDFALNIQQAEIHATAKTLEVQQAQFVLLEEGYRGAALAISSTDEEAIFRDVSITHCPPNVNSWKLSAAQIRLNRKSEIAVARDVAVNIGRLPALYIPYLRFPVGRSRISGLLPPLLESNSLRGYELSIPIYLNLAPHYDLTIIPQLSTRGNHSIAGEFRLLSRTSSTQLHGVFLPSDEEYREYLDSRIDRAPRSHTESDRRWYFGVQHQMVLRKWNADVDYSFVSDEDFLRDFGESIDDLGRVGLSRTAHLTYWGDQTDFSFSLERYEPFRYWETSIAKVPEISYAYLFSIYQMSFGVNSHLAHLKATNALTDSENVRGHVEVFWEVPLQHEWGAVVFHSARSTTRYEFPGNTHARRSLSEYYIDMYTGFERPFGTNRQYLHSIEPRITIARRTAHHLDHYPAFDDASRSLTIDSLMNPTRQIGLDHRPAVESVALGLQTDISDLRTMQTRFSFWIGLGLPRYEEENHTVTNNTMGLAANIHLTPNLAASFSKFRSSDHTDYDISEFRLKYNSESWRTTAWTRYDTEQDVRQSYLDFAIPVHQQWNTYSRLHYDWDDDEIIEAFVGIEYSGCCIEYRLLWYQNIRYEWVHSENVQTRTGIRLEISLKGLTSFGDNVMSYVNRGAQAPLSIH